MINHQDTWFQQISATLGMVTFILKKYGTIIGRDRPACIRNLQIGQRAIQDFFDLPQEDKKVINGILQKQQERKKKKETLCQKEG